MPATTSTFLNVNDIHKSLEFYRNLGFKVLKEWKTEDGIIGYVDLSLDGADFGLGNIHSNDDAPFREWVSTPLGAGVVVYFTVRDVGAIHDAAKAMRATIEVPLQDRSYGRVFTLNDPDGYTLTFLQEQRRAKAPAKRAQVAARRTSRPAKARGTKKARRTARR